MNSKGHGYPILDLGNPPYVGERDIEIMENYREKYVIQHRYGVKIIKTHAYVHTH